MVQILQSSDQDQIMEFERQLNPNPDMEWTMKSWSAPWRAESLQHYLPQGWSFGVWNEQKQMTGYFLAQPHLFMDSQTQSLWVEHVQAIQDSLRAELCEIAIKLSREKHFQRVYFSDSLKSIVQNLSFKPENWAQAPFFVKTVK